MCVLAVGWERRALGTGWDSRTRARLSGGKCRQIPSWVSPLRRFSCILPKTSGPRLHSVGSICSVGLGQVKGPINKPGETGELLGPWVPEEDGRWSGIGREQVTEAVQDQRDPLRAARAGQMPYLLLSPGLLSRSVAAPVRTGEPKTVSLTLPGAAFPCTHRMLQCAYMPGTLLNTSYMWTHRIPVRHSLALPPFYR